MRAPLLLSVLIAASTLFAACEHEPPPKKAPPAEPSTTTTPPPLGDPAQAVAPPAQPPPTPTAAVDAGADALAPVSQDCLDVSGHIAEVLISEAKDDQQKAQLEQEKTKIIRRSAEACTRDSWKPEVRTCFLKATKTEQMQVCAKDLVAP